MTLTPVPSHSINPVNCCTKIDRSTAKFFWICNRIPVISTITNLFHLTIRFLTQCFSNQCIQSSPYLKWIHGVPLALMLKLLIPFFGNHQWNRWTEEMNLLNCVRSLQSMRDTFTKASEDNPENIDLQIAKAFCDTLLSRDPVASDQFITLSKDTLEIYAKTLRENPDLQYNPVPGTEPGIDAGA